MQIKFDTTGLFLNNQIDFFRGMIMWFSLRLAYVEEQCWAIG
jgi:hypothetical protein